jgi:hypothetical protein
MDSAREIGEELIAAARGGNSERCEQLLCLGADIFYSPNLSNGFTALHYAAAGGHLDVARFLLDSADWCRTFRDVRIKKILNSSILFHISIMPCLNVFLIFKAYIDFCKYLAHCANTNSGLTVHIVG